MIMRLTRRTGAYIASLFGSVFRGTLVALAVIIVLAAVMARANYNATTGGATTFASVTVGGVHFAAFVNCDPVAGTTQCASVKAAGTPAAVGDPASVVTLSPNSIGTKITDGVSSAAVKAASTSPIATDPAAVVTLSPNSSGLITLGQANMANSAPVAIASDQSALNVAVTNANANGQATMANSSPVVIASDQPAFNTNSTPVVPTTGGLSVFFLQPTASDNHAVIKAGAGQVYKIDAFNNSATVNYLRLYNATTGFNGCNSASNLIYQMEIPAQTTVGGVATSWNQGMTFATGISICVTSGYATTDTTNATATAMAINVGYK